MIFLASRTVTSWWGLLSFMLDELVRGPGILSTANDRDVAQDQHVGTCS